MITVITVSEYRFYRNSSHRLVGVMVGNHEILDHTHETVRGRAAQQACTSNAITTQAFPHNAHRTKA